MMPLWIDLDEIADDDNVLWSAFCDGCFEPLALCECGLAYSKSEDESEDDDEQDV